MKEVTYVLQPGRSLDKLLDQPAAPMAPTPDARRASRKFLGPPPGGHSAWPAVGTSRDPLVAVRRVGP